MSRCPICGDSGKIRLPEQPSFVMPDIGQIGCLRTMIRTYPCPECSANVIPRDRVETLAVQQTYPRYETLVEEDELTFILKQGIARTFANELLKRGCIVWEDKDFGDCERYLRGTIGVVAPDEVATIEDRIRDRQYDRMDEVVRSIIADIQNWGSYYGHSFIEKSIAVDLTREVLRNYKEKRNDNIHRGCSW